MYEILEIKNEKYTILPLKDYENLLERLEDAEDIATANDIKRKITRCEEETFPAEVIHSIILDKKNPVKVYREYRGLTQQELADKVGIGLSMIKKIESGFTTGSLETIKSIAKVLNVDVEVFI